MWFVYALAGALFAAAIPILVKLGFDSVDLYLATAIRTCVVLVMAWGMVFIAGKQHGISTITTRGWIFLALSGVAAGASWLFNFKALQVSDVSKAMPIDKLSIVFTVIMAVLFLGEAQTWKTVIGLIVMTAGIVILAL